MLKECFVATDASQGSKGWGIGIVISDDMNFYSDEQRCFYFRLKVPEENNYISGQLDSNMNYKSHYAEQLGALSGIKLARSLGYSIFTLCFDCFAIKRGLLPQSSLLDWLKMESYERVLSSYIESNALVVDFVHTKAHSGIYINMLADKLAKEARNCAKILTEDDILNKSLEEKYFAYHSKGFSLS